MIKNEAPDFLFGNNVIEAIKDFKSRYNRFITEDFDVDSLNENETKVLFTIKEYGIPISKNHIIKQMLTEIVENIKDKFSSYDVVEAIKVLSETSQLYKTSFKVLYKKYFE